LLKSQGYNVVLAENGKQAIEKALQNSPDVILLDVMMPVMDGFEACKILRSNPVTTPIPILIVTALSDREDRLEGIGIGASDFITKPIDIEEVLLRVRNSIYTKKLYDKVKENYEEVKRLSDELRIRNEQLQLEKDRSEKLLLNILPKPIAERLKAGEEIIADRFEDATILFADIVGFTSFSSDKSPGELVNYLNKIWSEFDRLTDKYKLEKIKTLGDGYMIAGGLPSRQDNHAEAIADMALEMKEIISKYKFGKDVFLLRIGINTGSVVAGVIGEKKFFYDLWGDTVNTAQRMQAHSEPGQIQVTYSTYSRLKDNYIFKERGSISVKGKGEITTYFLLGKK